MSQELPAIDHNALSTQVGGCHYKSMAIQPVEFALVNGLNTCQANIIKYVCRHRHKGGADDLKKAIHYCDLWLELADKHENLKWADWCLNPPGGKPVVDEFVVANALTVDVVSVIYLVCWMPYPPKVKTARAALVGMLMKAYGEVA